MCGISGYYSRNKAFTKDDLNAMTDAIKHRGPDAFGHYYKESVGLGHRRLSIIDLSKEANQPMISHCKNYVIIFNGEIYNYKIIAKELNINFNTNSDTEVILEAFIKWGSNFVNKLNGMFAIAIYNIKEESLHIYRDRIGIKPLFYFWNGNDFAFSSELKSLTKINSIKEHLSLNKTTISEFLHLGYIPSPNTIYNNIYKFPAGSYAIIKNSDLSIKPYWDLKNIIKENTVTDLKEAKSQLDFLLNNSVKQRLISDVPYGTFLSGGIDSSLVTALAQKHSSENINTFSIGFKEQKFNEADHAKKIAKYLNTNHHEFIVSHNDAIELIDSITDSYDEPYADSSAIPTMLVSKMAKKHVTMTLSGDGGDELFMGYGAYNWAERLSNNTVKNFRKPISFGLSLLSNKYKRAAKVFQYPEEESKKSHIFSQEQYMFSKSELNNLIKADFSADISFYEDYSNLKRVLTPAEQQAFFDLNYYLKDDLLTKVDRASMKYSLESRVPLLDHNIIEFAINLSPELKIKDGVQKYLLKEVLYDYIPKEFFDRPKRGFSIPLSDWLSKDLKYLIDNYLSKSVIESFGVVNYKHVETLMKRYLKGEKYLYNRLWLLILLHKWLITNHI